MRRDVRDVLMPSLALACTGLYLAAGHEGSGLTLGPATAEVMWQYISTGLSASPAARLMSPSVMVARGA